MCKNVDVGEMKSKRAMIDSVFELLRAVDDGLDDALAVLALTCLGRIERLNSVLELVTVRDKRLEVDATRSNEGNSERVIVGSVPGSSDAHQRPP